MKKGTFLLVLHSHLPYCRRAGRWPHGEEWLYEAATETYIPLLNALYDLAEEGLPVKATIGITPVLAEQLADSLILEHLEEYIHDKISRAEKDAVRFGLAEQSDYAGLAGWYQRWYQRLWESYAGRFNRDIIGAFRKLQEKGHVEILTSAATHGYLPLMERDSSIYGQLRVGVDSYKRHFGRAPRGIWLPECAYRPAYYRDEGGRSYLKPGSEQFLAELGIGAFFAETHTVEGGMPVGKAMGDAIGPYGGPPKRRVVPLPSYTEPKERTTFQPYYVQGTDVAVFGRDNRTGQQVWSATFGYPGDYDYREFHKKDDVSGIQYWRVTAARSDLSQKQPYNPEWAEGRRKEHAQHFSRVVEEHLEGYFNSAGRPGVVTAAYDAELFGHWWFEGVDWIKDVLRNLSRSSVVELSTASDYLEKHPPEDVLALPESSWGLGGHHFTWMNDNTNWMWEPIHRAEYRVEALAARYPKAEGSLKEILNQAARELLLLQSSDWPFLVTTGQAKEYAIGRFQEHVGRFEALAGIAEKGTVSPEDLEFCKELWEVDKLFPNIDYRVFAEREKQTGL